MSWDKTPLYFCSWNFVYFQQKEPIKLQIWWNFTWPVERLKFGTLMGWFCPNHLTFQLKKVMKSCLSWQWRVMQSLKKNWLAVSYEDFGEISPNHSKVWETFSKETLLSKIYKVSAPKIHGSYLSWYWTVMQNLNKPWPCGFKITWRIGLAFIRALKKLKSCSLMGIFCPKHVMFQLKNFKGIMCWQLRVMYNLKENWLVAWTMT